MSIISVITDPSIGGTFLTWSIEFLSGHKNYFYFRKNDFVSLPNDPLTTINAHGFRANQPLTLSELNTCYNTLETKNINNNHTVYFHSLSNEDRSWPPDPSLDKIAIDTAFKKSKKCIVLRLADSYFLYGVRASARTLIHKFNSDKLNRSFDEQNENFIDYFYGSDKKHWQDVLKLNHIWDLREFLALNLRPFRQPLLDKTHLSSREYFLLHSADCWLNLDQSIHEIFQYIEAKIDQERWNHWIDVYKKWKLLHQNRIKFSWYFNDIINAIINGDNLDITRFDLDLYQEAAIQHVLLYQHNLNIKTHNVDKFHNTSQLHSLLEPNIHHTLERIY